jgi:hypothetical protein
MNRTGAAVRVFDVSGRCLAEVAAGRTFEFRRAGIYYLKPENGNARKIVRIK